MGFFQLGNLGFRAGQGAAGGGGGGGDPDAPSGHVLAGTFQFTANRSAGATTGGLTGWTAVPAVNDYAYNPDTTEYIQIVFFNVGDGAVEMTRAVLGSSASGISSASVFKLYKPV